MLNIFVIRSITWYVLRFIIYIFIIYFYNRIIKISKTVYAKDKEEKGRWYLGTTKTVGSQRDVYICDSLYKILVNYKKSQDNYKNQYFNNSL